MMTRVICGSLRHRDYFGSIRKKNNSNATPQQMVWLQTRSKGFVLIKKTGSGLLHYPVFRCLTPLRNISITFLFVKDCLPIILKEFLLTWITAVFWLLIMAE